MYELQPPISTNLGWIFAVFAIALIVFHLIFVWPGTLKKRHWLVVDYIWLGTALLGVIGSAGIGRQITAESFLPSAKALVESLASDVESDLRFGTSIAICRSSVRSEFSPPQVEFDRIQKELDAQCTWFVQALQKLQKSPLSKRQILSFEDLGGSPPDSPIDWPTNVRNTIDRYNAAIMQFDHLSDNVRRTTLELMLLISGPFLLVIALALRIAKVSAELWP